MESGETDRWKGLEGCLGAVEFHILISSEEELRVSAEVQEEGSWAGGLRRGRTFLE